MSKRRRKPPRNPISRPLAVFSCATLLTIGLGAWLGHETVVRPLAVPMVLGCMLLGSIYTAFAIRQGWIGIVNHLGRIDHFEKRIEPIRFWIVAMSYLALALPSAIYMSLLLAGIR